MFAHPSLTQLAADLSNGRLPLLTYLDQLEAYFDQREPKVLAFVPENGRFARLLSHIALAAQPDLVTLTATPAGDAGLSLLHNEMQRALLVGV